MTRTWRGDNQNGLERTGVNQTEITCKRAATCHFPAKCSVMIAINRSRLPKIARWMMTGLDGGLSALADSSADRYFKLNRSGSWKSSWIVAHWNERFNASRMVMSIFGP